MFSITSTRSNRKDQTEFILKLEREGKITVKKISDCLLINAVPPFTKEEIMALIFEDKFKSNKAKE